MTPQELEEKARGIAAELTKPEGLKLLYVLLERSSPDEIVEQITLAKISREADEIGGALLRKGGF